MNSDEKPSFMRLIVSFVHYKFQVHCANEGLYENTARRCKNRKCAPRDSCSADGNPCDSAMIHSAENRSGPHEKERSDIRFLFHREESHPSSRRSLFLRPQEELSKIKKGAGTPGFLRIQILSTPVGSCSFSFVIIPWMALRRREDPGR